MLVFYSRPVGDGGLRRSSPLAWVPSFREPMPVVLFHTPHLRRGFIRHMVFPDGFSVTCVSLHQILALHLMGWRGAATLRVCKGLICKGLSKWGVEMWPKNGCVSTPLLNCYLIISELRIYPWPRPDWFVFFDIQLYSYITL